MPLSNSLYNEIMRDYEQVKIQNRDKQNSNISMVYAKIPRIKIIDDCIATSALDRYKLYRKDKDKKIVLEFEKEIEELKKEKSKLLKDNGFEEDIMNPVYECSICKDTGYVDRIKCSCFRKKEVDLLYRVSNLNSIKDNHTFDSVVYEYYDGIYLDKLDMSLSEYMKKIVNLCKEYVENFETKKDNLLFIGDTGVGKTFLSHCIGNALIEKLYSVVYLESTDLFEKIGKEKFSSNEEDNEFYLTEYVNDCELLIIDDLGTELTNSFVNSTLFYIINNRLTNGKATIVSTNCELSLLRDVYSERITSRIKGSYISIPLYGKDIRKML